MEVNNTKIFKEISIDKDHINNFVLENETGTKNMQAKFHKNAVKERNLYVTKQQKLFDVYQKKVYCELISRMNSLYPTDKTSELSHVKEISDRLESLIKLTSSQMTVNYKLEFDYLLSSIKPNISLNVFNAILVTFIDKFRIMGITLGLEDFNYSMFTIKYMATLFKNRNNDDFDDIIKDTFEKIYFECPDIITHFKYNLIVILKNNKRNIEKYLNIHTSKLLEDEGLTNDNVIDAYLKERKEAFWLKETDSFINLNIFLDKKRIIGDYLEGSSVRTTNFNVFCNGEYSNLDDNSKANYKESISDLYCVLLELKEYYRYEFIVTDLVKRFKDKDKVKSSYPQKEKELLNEDKKRVKIYKDYLKSCKKSLFGGINKNKQKVLKLRMNEEIEAIEKVNTDFKELEVTYYLANSLNDASSIYDLLINSFSSYSYLEKEFISTFSEDEGFNLKDEFNRFFKFLFNPYNNFLRKTNAFTDFSISEIIADKYKILGLKVSGENILKENIDSALDNIRFIMTIINIDNGNLDLKDMKFIVDIKTLEPVVGYENINDNVI